MADATRRAARPRTHPTKPSDALVKWMFKQARHAESLLRAIFPEEMSALLRWRTLAIEDAGHVNTALRAREGDLVLSIAFRSEPGRLYALIEHQRKVEQRMMLRTGEYLMRTWQDVVRSRGYKGRLPPVVSIVIYNGHRPWTVPLSFRQMVHLPRPAGAARWLAWHVPHFRTHLVDLHGGRMAGVAKETLTPLARVVLWCLSVAGSDRLFEQGVRGVAGSLGEVLREPGAADALEVLLRYLAATHPGLPAEKIRGIIESVLPPGGQEVIVSFLDEIKNEGRRDALEQTLLALLTHRFGRVSKDIQARVHEAPEATLRRWTLRVLDAATAEDVLTSKRLRRSTAPARRPAVASPRAPTRPRST